MEKHDYINFDKPNGVGSSLGKALSQLTEDANSQYTGQNSLLASRLLPKQVVAQYPPNGRQRTNTKAVDLATLVTVEPMEGFSNDMYFAIPNEGPVPFLHVYRRKNNGKNYFQGFIRTSESMQQTEKYRCSRLVSCLIEFRSDTRPGGNFDISGQFNAITVPFLPPDFQSQDHNQLIKFKDSPADVRTNVPILDGVSYLKPLSENNPLIIRSELASSYTYGSEPTGDWWRPEFFNYSTSIVTAYTSDDFGKDGVTGNTVMSNDENPPETPEFAISGDATQRLPSMCIYEIQYTIDYIHQGNIILNGITARVYMRHGEQEYIEVDLGRANVASGQNVNEFSSTYHSAYFYAFSTVERVEIYLQAISPKPIQRQALALKAYMSATNASDKEVTIVSVRGAPNDVTYSISGRLNYEYIGGYLLKPDLSCQTNYSTDIDLASAIRVQEYLSEAANVGCVLTCLEYEQFCAEVTSHDFDRSRHSRYAFLGPIFPLLRTAMRYAPRILGLGNQAIQMGRDIHAAVRNSKNNGKDRRAMLAQSQPANVILPSRGAFAGAQATFQANPQKKTLPNVTSLYHSGKSFQMTRRFATVDNENQPEVGDLTISSEALNQESYKMLQVNSVQVHFQNYEFGESYVPPEQLDQALKDNSEELAAIANAYQDQEPLRTLAWIAETKEMEHIYLTSNLEGVRGGSIGFTIEACWYGFIDDYVYTGSSSPETGWLPSYPLSPGLQYKLQLDKIAIKTVAAELLDAKQLGAHIPWRFAGEELPSKLAVESSNWFFEMQMSKRVPVQVAPTQIKQSQPVIQERLVYRDNPDKDALIEDLKQELERAKLAASSAKSTFKGEQDFFPEPEMQKQPKSEKKKKAKVDPKDELPYGVTVRGYPAIDTDMEGAAEINHLLDLIASKKVPRPIPEIVYRYLEMRPQVEQVGPDQFIEYVTKGTLPPSDKAAAGAMNTFIAFLKSGIGMPDSARIADVNSPYFNQQLGDIVARLGGTQHTPGYITKSELNTAIGYGAQVQAYEAGKTEQAVYEKGTKNMIPVKDRQPWRGKKKGPSVRFSEQPAQYPPLPKQQSQSLAKPKQKRESDQIPHSTSHQQSDTPVLTALADFSPAFGQYEEDQ